MEYRYADKLEIGDTIMVAESNFLNLGFFAGYGRGTIQYYSPANIVYAKERADEKKVEFTIKHCRKGYLQETPHRVAKMNNPVFGMDKDEKDYYEARRILMDIKFIKQ